MEIAMTEKLPKNHYSVSIHVPADTELPPTLRKKLEDLASEIDKYPGATSAVPLDDLDCGTKCGLNITCTTQSAVN
jgi:hypothetical protein